MQTFIVVGKLSPVAQEELRAACATIERIHLDPPLFLICLKHEQWYRTHNGEEYQDLELEEGQLVIHSQDLELAYDRRPYSSAYHSLWNIYEPVPI